MVNHGMIKHIWYCHMIQHIVLPWREENDLYVIRHGDPDYENDALTPKVAAGGGFGEETGC